MIVLGGLVADSPANPRHLNRLLWLLPSGSDQVNKFSMRGTKEPTIVTVIKCLGNDLMNRIIRDEADITTAI
jgi:hypothetical protein